MAKRRKRKKKKRKFNTNFKKAVGKDVERREKENRGYGYLQLPDNIPVWKAEPKSKVRFDIIPYIVSDENHTDTIPEEGIAVPDELWYKRPFSIHRNVGVENRSEICLRSVGKRCPICEWRDNRLKNGASWKDPEIKDANASDRNLYIVIPKRQNDYDNIPHIWDISEFCFQDLLDTELKEDEEYWSFPNIKDGKTLRVRFDEGKIGDTSFPKANRIDFYDRKKPYDYDILNDIPDLDKVLNVLSYKELEAKFMEMDSDDIIDENEKPWEEEDEYYEDEEFEEEEEYYEDEEFEDEEFEDEEFEEEEPWDNDEFEEEENWEDDDWDDEEFEEFEEEKPKKPKRTKKSKSKKRKRKRKKK